MISNEPLMDCEIIDINAFDLVYLHYSHMAFRHIRKMRLSFCTEQVEDLVQETFVKIYKALQNGKTVPTATFPFWLSCIASHVTIDALRRQRSSPETPFSCIRNDPAKENDLWDTVEQCISDKQAYFEQYLADNESIERALQQLPHGLAVCLLLHEYEGFSCAEIAELLCIKVPAVRMRLTRARLRFRYFYRRECC